MTDKITIDSALLQQALDALDIVSLELGIDWLRPEFADAGSTATALRAALAAPQPEQPAEPVALVCDICGVETQDPWHYSEGNQRHLHACDKCKAPQPAQPADPVALIVRTQYESGVRLQWASVEAAHNTKPGPLYAAPPAQQPLTDEQIIDMANKALPGWSRKDNDMAYIEVARAIEAHITRGKP